MRQTYVILIILVRTQIFYPHVLCVHSFWLYYVSECVIFVIFLGSEVLTNAMICEMDLPTIFLCAMLCRVLLLWTTHDSMSQHT